MIQRRVQVRVHISGKVQGVSYRAFARREAERLGLKGWVRNLDDGRVEAVFHGPQPVVEQMVNWCRRGSLHANVEDVTVTPEGLEAFQGFDVR